MDEYPFEPLVSHEWSVLMFYDYTDFSTDKDLQRLFDEYEKIILIGWSMGVWAGQHLFEEFPATLDAAVAINGTLCPINDEFGIPETVVQATLADIDEKQRLKFYYRMCRDRILYRSFLEKQPQRSVENQKGELAVLLANTTNIELAKSIYSCAIISERDFIMPTKNQLNYWPEEIVKLIDESHFPFYAYKSWDEIISNLKEE